MNGINRFGAFGDSFFKNDMLLNSRIFNSDKFFGRGNNIDPFFGDFEENCDESNAKNKKKPGISIKEISLISQVTVLFINLTRALFHILEIVRSRLDKFIKVSPIENR